MFELIIKYLSVFSYRNLNLIFPFKLTVQTYKPNKPVICGVVLAVLLDQLVCILFWQTFTLVSICFCLVVTLNIAGIGCSKTVRGWRIWRIGQFSYWWGRTPAASKTWEALHFNTCGQGCYLFCFILSFDSFLVLDLLWLIKFCLYISIINVI